MFDGILIDEGPPSSLSLNEDSLSSLSCDRCCDGSILCDNDFEAGSCGVWVDVFVYGLYPSPGPCASPCPSLRSWGGWLLVLTISDAVPTEACDMVSVDEVTKRIPLLVPSTIEFVELPLPPVVPIPEMDATGCEGGNSRKERTSLGMGTMATAS